MITITANTLGLGKAPETTHSDPSLQGLKTIADRIREVVLERLLKTHPDSIQNYIVAPMVERFLNERANALNTADPTHISFLIQDLGGYGDLIFGVKAFQIGRAHV
jgi:hypothetical protein